ncbi:putative methyltransferase-domain-containing protein [Hypoxylon rubiginosum]|uniref:Methyltransferase-domain-containing protein n=1 Tax=Hypoxylon rubiginosum TaxID=110542 RepID=A0ACC0CSU3_9PEZI|nr:putative methyltransferase-domain-containing protein [Hypoxylon rubiginosum]
MHYIRLLRPPRFDATTHDISLLITITTDLGDSFLRPDRPVDLALSADSATTVGETLLRKPELLHRARWAAGMRVLDIKIPLAPHLRRHDVTCTIQIHPSAQGPPMGYLKNEDALPWRVAGRRPVCDGLIMPASVKLVGGVCEPPVSVRTLKMNAGTEPQDRFRIRFEEDIGESIARHVWDAGVVTACYLADACLAREGEEREIRSVLPVRGDSVSVLELGTGVGILGITVARIVRQAAAAQGRVLKEATVLLTDLPEAEERATANIARLSTVLEQQNRGPCTVDLRYENLDWDEGRHGRFGPLASACTWDLVILSDCTYNVDSLPALVGTLSALHTANLKHSGFGEDGKTSVLLATKPRHSSEQALFGLLEADNWQYRVVKSIPLPKIGEEDDIVEMYMLEKGKETS